MLKVHRSSHLRLRDAFHLNTLKNRVLRDTPDMMVDVKLSNSRSFMYNETNNPNLVSDSIDTVEKVNISRLFSLIANPLPSQFAYFTAPLVNFSNQVLQDLNLKNHVSIWISSRDCVTRAHYDTLENHFVQVDGKKRFKIWDPTQHFNLQVFPDSHPRARKSQIDLCAPVDDAQFLLYQGLEAPILDAVLKPGDSITIPSFYFHQVETLDEPSVSINTFSSSTTAGIASRIFSAASHAKSLEELHRFIPSILKHSVGVDPAIFLQKMLLSRFRIPLSVCNIPDSKLAKKNSEPKNGYDVALWTDYFATLRIHCDDISPEYSQGVVEIVASHLCELLVVRSQGADKVCATLERIAQEIHFNN